MDHRWQLIHNKVATEANQLSFDVFISAPGYSEEIGDQVENFRPCGIFFHCHEKYQFHHRADPVLGLVHRRVFERFNHHRNTVGDPLRCGLQRLIDCLGRYEVSIGVRRTGLRRWAVS